MGRAGLKRAWYRLPDEQLLDVRLCDLGLRIEGSPLQSRIEQLYAELALHNIRFRPHYWLSSDWFSPEDVPGIAVPFFLSHPRLIKLERRMMLDVEGGTKTWCMQLLRHETGHAIEVAYRLKRRAKWRTVFGRSSRPYPEFYKPKPFSRDYVLHLDWWYAQSHPVEDFAETFAVWLKPGSEWRRKYKGWPALKKLEYVDELMSGIADRAPMVRSRARLEPLDELDITLREYYEAKQRRYGTEHPDVYPQDLRRLFSDLPAHGNKPPATALIRRMGPELRELVSSWTGESVYTVNMLLKEMIKHCRRLDLRVHRPEREVRLELAVLLTMHTMNFVYSDDHRLAL